MAGGYNHREKAAEAEEKTRESKPKIHHIEVHPAMGGGHHIQHHYHPGPDGQFHEPKSHHFGTGKGVEAMQHIAKHAGIAARVEGGAVEEAGESPAEERAEQESGGEAQED